MNWINIIVYHGGRLSFLSPGAKNLNLAEEGMRAVTHSEKFVQKHLPTILLAMTPMLENLFLDRQVK